MSRIDDLLAEARERLERVDPAQAQAAVDAGAVLVDIRAESQRARDGVVPGSVFIARNVLEWRCDPAGSNRDERVADPARRLIVMCDAGYQSSLAAAILHDLGHDRATDLDGGFQAWRAAGLPVEPLEQDGDETRLIQPRGGRSSGRARWTPSATCTTCCRPTVGPSCAGTTRSAWPSSSSAGPSAARASRRSPRTRQPAADQE